MCVWRRWATLCFVLVIIFMAFCGCASNNKLATSDTELTKLQDTIRNSVNDGMSAEVLEYISDDITILVQDVDDTRKVSISARAILPQSIPMVAENLCASAINTITENGVENYTISVEYRQESNEGGVAEGSYVEWHTYDGETGRFTDEGNGVVGAKYTIDELYAYFDGYGKQ